MTETPSSYSFASVVISKNEYFLCLPQQINADPIGSWITFWQINDGKQLITL
jgi:glycine cleavage system H lipoate-binding protein